MPPDVTVPPELLERARSAEKVTVLTGAGMSAESGVTTFREPEHGLWERYDPMELATTKAWFSDRPFVWAWNVWRMMQVQRAEPNRGHVALAKWQARNRYVRIATQNIDDLHERAGSKDVTHVHGSLFQYRCDTCEMPYSGPVYIPKKIVKRLDPPLCPFCFGMIRPAVVWFGEMLPYREMLIAEISAREADLVLVVGTSGVVYPFAALPEMAHAQGAMVVEINPNETEMSDASHIDVTWRATAAEALPALVKALFPKPEGPEGCPIAG
ncbi:MAG: NAD-dependent deacylase [Dermatophilus congolensis]|nr:NAD-dependent deacylase [Dermatophilus congolensis]